MGEIVERYGPTFGEKIIGLIIHRQMLLPTADNMSGRKMAIDYVDEEVSGLRDEIAALQSVLKLAISTEQIDVEGRPHPDDPYWITAARGVLEMSDKRYEDSDASDC